MGFLHFRIVAFVIGKVVIMQGFVLQPFVLKREHLNEKFLMLAFGFFFVVYFLLTAAIEP